MTLARVVVSTTTPRARRKGLTPLATSSAPHHTTARAATALTMVAAVPAGWSNHRIPAATRKSDRARFGHWAITSFPVRRSRNTQSNTLRGHVLITENTSRATCRYRCLLRGRSPDAGECEGGGDSSAVAVGDREECPVGPGRDMRNRRSADCEHSAVAAAPRGRPSRTRALEFGYARENTFYLARHGRSISRRRPTTVAIASRSVGSELTTRSRRRSAPSTTVTSTMSFVLALAASAPTARA